MVLKVIVAENSGFCFGVKEAMDTTINVLNNESEANISSLGPLIHNNQAIEKLEQLGLDVINDINDKDLEKVIIRSHGVPLDVYTIASNNNVELVDCTCPFVRKIQKKVKDCYNQGKSIVIIGNPHHPEVVGINGWCENKAYVVNSVEDIKNIPKLDGVCVVAQTTATAENFTKLSQLVAEKSSEAEICNTICNATKTRQSSCKSLAQKSDAMIVIGGYHSSNTQKLVEISKKYCNNVYHVEIVDELPLDILKNYHIVGITAGASTPTWIIEEVYDKMVEISKDIESMEDLLKDDIVSISEGDILNGEVITVGEYVSVNINYKADGIISKEELSSDSSLEPKDIVSVGDKIDVLVLELNDGEGNVVLSKKRVDNRKSFTDLETAFKNGEVVSAKVDGVVKGGVTVNIKGLRGFIPASQVSNSFIKDLNSLLGEVLDCVIIEFDREKNNIVLSRKQVEAEEIASNKDKIWSKIQKGQKITGEVKRITNFGAFIDIGGMDGLAHISDLSWSRVSDPSEIVTVGDQIDVLILDIDKDKERVSLGVKQLTSHPWDDADKNYKVGSIVDGKVVRLLNFGAFIELEAGIDGLVHISEISDDHIANPSEKLNIGDSVKVKVLSIDSQNKKMQLSIKEADTTQIEAIEKYSASESEEFTIGDILNLKNKK